MAFSAGADGLVLLCKKGDFAAVLFQHDELIVFFRKQERG